jgi:hypothetical protein
VRRNSDEVAGMVEIGSDEVNVLLIIEHAPDGHRLGREHAIREDDYKRTTRAEDAPDLLKDGDGLGDVLDGHSQHDSVKRVGLEGQLGGCIHVVYYIVVQVGIVGHLFCIES